MGKPRLLKRYPVKQENSCVRHWSTGSGSHSNHEASCRFACGNDRWGEFAKRRAAVGGGIGRNFIRLDVCWKRPDAMHVRTPRKQESYDSECRKKKEHEDGDQARAKMNHIW